MPQVEGTRDPVAAADRNALSDFIAAYPTMLTRIQNMQDDMTAIKGRADQLANMSTWSGLTLAATTARLQQVMPSLGQDLSTLSTDMKTTLEGLDNMLRAMRVFWKTSPYAKQ